MKKYSLVEELQDKNASILQKSSNQAMEIADLKAQSVELIDKLKNLEEVNKELQDKMFEQNNEIQSARLGMQEAEVAQLEAREALADASEDFKNLQRSLPSSERMKIKSKELASKLEQINQQWKNDRKKLVALAAENEELRNLKEEHLNRINRLEIQFASLDLVTQADELILS